MDSLIIEDNETVEDLQLAGLRLIQKKDAFRFGMDSVLLADFADIKENDTVADLGCGNGAISVLLIGRNKGKKIYGFEIQNDIAEIARKNILLNHLDGQFKVICDDVSNALNYLERNSLDSIICNPPYGMSGHGIINPAYTKATARHQTTDTMSAFLRASFFLLKGKGKISLCYPASQMLQIMSLMQSVHLEPKRFRLVYPYIDKPAKLVLIEAVKDAKPLLHPLPPLIVYNEDGSMTSELKSIYHISKTDQSSGDGT